VLVVASLAELVTVSVLLTQIVRYADLAA